VRGLCDAVAIQLGDFVHLHVHTAYSLSAGAITIKELANLCRAEHMPAVTISDTGNLFGALEFATRCSAAGVQPIIGCEIALELARRPDRVAALENGQLMAKDLDLLHNESRGDFLN